MVWKGHLMTPYLLFIGFVENCFKHGNPNKKGEEPKDYVEKEIRFGHIPWDNLGQPKNILDDLRSASLSLIIIAEIFDKWIHLPKLLIHV